MRQSFLLFWGLLIGLTWAGLVAAVGFGSITVSSSLGQPLQAEIELVGVDRADKASLVAQLASIEAFKGAGIDYPRGLPKLKFQLMTRTNGDAYLKASSDQPLNEPFVSVLIELNWASGRLLRQYTFLLDPPGFVAEKPPVQTAQPIEPVMPTETAPATLPAVAAALEPLPAQPETPAVAPEQTPVPAAKIETVPLAIKPKLVSVPSAHGSIRVKRGDTLSALARRNKSPDVSLEKMLVALYRANKSAFEGKNMNRLRVGKILRVPGEAELAQLSQKTAAQDVHVHVVDWNAYRQKLAAVRNQSDENHPRQAVTGKITPRIAEQTPTVKPNAQEVLRLSKGEAVGDRVSPGGQQSAQDQANAREEEAVARAKAAHDTQQRSAALEKNIADMQRLVDLKNQAAASAPISAVAASSAVQSGSAVASVSSVNVASAVVASSVPAVKPKVAVPAPKIDVPSPSIIDTVLSNPQYLGGGAAVVLGLGSLAWMRFRRAKEEAVLPSKAQQSVNALARIAEPVAPSPETGDFTNMAAAPVIPNAETGEVDPLVEAELFLSFGRDKQAEELLRGVLLKNPDNILAKLKLLSVFASREDTQSFQALALELQPHPAEWSKAAALGRSFDPTNPLYGADTDHMTDSPSVQALEPAAPVVDFDLDFGNAATEAETPLMTDLDLDMGQQFDGGDHTMIISTDEIQSAQLEPMDFDITATHPGGNAPAPEALELSTMDFDLSAISPEVQPVTPNAQDSSSNLTAMDFDLTETHATVPDLPETEAVAEFVMPEMDFDLTASQPQAEKVLAPIAEPEVAAFAEPANTPAVASVVEPELELELEPQPELEAEMIAPQAGDAPAPFAEPAAIEIVSDPAPAQSLDDLIFDVTGERTALPAAPVENIADLQQINESFSLDFPQDSLPQTAPVPATAIQDLGLSDISLELDEAATMLEPEQTAVKNAQWQEVATKLDLAKAYQEMGDLDGAREILAEVVLEGDETQRQTAEDLIQQLV